MNRALMNLLRSILHHKFIEKIFCAEAFATAVYARNRETSRVVPPKVTAHHPIWNTYVCLDRGAGTCYPGTKTKKLDARIREAMMNGYSFASKGYKL